MCRVLAGGSDDAARGAPSAPSFLARSAPDGLARRGQPGYGQPGGYQGVGSWTGGPGYQTTGTNGLAIASLACGVGQVLFGILAGIPAIILGHMARRQIRQTGEQGDGMALAGLILGYIGLVVTVLVVIFVIVAVAHSAS